MIQIETQKEKKKRVGKTKTASKKYRKKYVFGVHKGEEREAETEELFEEKMAESFSKL